MYCPVCFNNSLSLSPKGVIDIVINGKQMDASRFLFNTGDQNKEELMAALAGKKLKSFSSGIQTFTT